MRFNRKIVASVACLALAAFAPMAANASPKASSKPGAVDMKCRRMPSSVAAPAPADSVVQQGSPAPDFTANRLDCGSTTMKQLANGHVTFINFFASWCEYCIAEANDLTTFYNTYHAKGLNAIGIDTADDGPPAGNPSLFYNKYHFPFVSVWDAADESGSDPIWKAYATQPAVACIPTTMWLHKDGTIASVFVGQMAPADMLRQYAWAQEPQSTLMNDPNYLAAQAQSSKCLG
jgi:cytochrome c biogenesis protein CcmG/thiol:disulfide interchange protein DsbE